jgi:hypothetical protein
MAEWAEPIAPVDEPRASSEDTRSGGGDGTALPPAPPAWLPPESSDTMLRYRRAAPWIIAVFGLMGAVILLVVPASALSEIEPTSRRTIVLASILAFSGVAVAIISSALALAPRSSFIEPVHARRSRFLKYVSARRMVEDALARQTDTEAAALVSEGMKQRLVRIEKERNAVLLGFVGVMVGAIAIGSAMGVMVWEFENPTTVFEIDRIHADTIRIEADTRRIAAETAHISTATELDEGELAVQTQRLELELELLQATIVRTRAEVVHLEAEIEAAPLIEVVVSQIADVEIAIEAILEQLIDLRIEAGSHSHTIAG